MARAFAGPLCRFSAGVGGVRGEAVSLLAGDEGWRQQVERALGLNLRAPLLGAEDPTAPALWADLGDAGWMALKLFAVYAERSDLELPDTVPALLELDR